MNPALAGMTAERLSGGLQSSPSPLWGGIPRLKGNRPISAAKDVFVDEGVAELALWIVAGGERPEIAQS